jgi:hydroxyacylglutathione hydrolase
MRALLVLALAVSGCAVTPPPVVTFGPPPVIHQIELSASNVFLVRSKAPILIDAGSPGDLEDLEERLGSLDVRLPDVKLAILTHGHGDHAALGSDYQKAGIKVAMGTGDLPMARAGRNDELKPTNFTAWLIRPFIDYEYKPFVPDILINEAGLDLRPYGLAAKALQMPGHTPGSVVVLLEDGSAFVGDQLLGGNLGGAFFPGDAGEHYYQADLEANRRNIQTLLKKGVRLFYLGHGGPVTRESVIDWLELDPKTMEPVR